MVDDRLFWVDILKIFSVFAVILIHSAAPLLIQYVEAGEQFWWSANLYNSISRWCIPVFFMISGAFLIEKANNAPMSSFFRRRVQRTLVPFLLWSAIYFFWRIHINGEDLQFASFFSLFFQEPLYYHLWFFYVLLVLYLFAPIFSAYMKGADKTNAAYFLIIWFLFASILPMIENYFGFTTRFAVGSMDATFYYTGYFLLGYLLRDVKIDAMKSALLFSIFILGLFLTAYGTFDLTVVKNGGEFSGLFYEYASFNVFLMAVSIFLLARNLELRGSFRRPGFTRIIAACVPGIFLIHAMVIAVYKRGLLGFTFSETFVHPAAGIPIFAIAVFIGSLLPVLVIRSVPVLNRIVP